MTALKQTGSAALIENEADAIRRHAPTEPKVMMGNGSKDIDFPYYRCTQCEDCCGTEHATSALASQQHKAFRQHIWSTHGLAILTKYTEIFENRQKLELKKRNVMLGQTQLGFAPQAVNRMEEVSNTTLGMVICCNLPFAIVENRLWRRMGLAGLPGHPGGSKLSRTNGRPDRPASHPLQTRRALLRNLAVAFALILKKLKANLANVDGFSISLDGWRSGRKNLQSLHLYCVDNEGRVQPPQLIGMLPIIGSHTADKVSETVLFGLGRLGLISDDGPGNRPRMVALTADGASNMGATSATLAVPFVHCCAHALNLVTQVRNWT